jgi:hypothetical protein
MFDIEVVHYTLVQITLHPSPFAKAVYERNPHTANAIGKAAAEIDGAGFFKVLGGAGYFGYTKALVKYLRQHLVIKYKIIAIVPELDSGQHFAAKGPVAGVVFG